MTALSPMLLNRGTTANDKTGDDGRTGALKINRNTRWLEAIARGAVISQTTNDQPASPTVGDLYIITAGKTGAAWSTFATGSLALYAENDSGNEWYEIVPWEGAEFRVRDTNKKVIWTGAVWRIEDALRPEDFGAVANGTTDDSTALQAWLNSGEKYLSCEGGTYGVGTMLTIPKGVNVSAAGATFKPVANVNVIRMHGGAILRGFPDIIVTGQSGWNSKAVVFDGASQAGGDTTNFRMPDTTICEVRCVGKTDSDGTNGGDAIGFITEDDGVNNQWITGVWLWTKIKGFDRGIYMLKDGSSTTRTFVNQCRIFADVGSSRQPLVMDSEDVNGFHIDGNLIEIEAQSRDVAADHTSIANIICGQKNRISLEQIDWVGGSTGSLKAIQIKANTRDLKLDVRRLNTSYIENLSTERSVVIDNGIDGAGPTYGGLPTVVRAGAPASRTATGENGDVAFDDDWLYVYEGANDWKQFPTSNWRVLSRNFVAASLTGTTSETTLRTISVPALALGPNGVIRITTYWTHTSSANAKTLRTKFGGTTFFNPAPTTTQTSRHIIEIANRNANNSQIATQNLLGASSALGGQNAAFVTAAIDTSAAQDIVLTAQLANSGETITLEGYLIEISYGG